MNNVHWLLVIYIWSINCLSNINHSNFQKESLTGDTVYVINKEEPKNFNYKKAEFEVSSKGNLYFKYDNIYFSTAFRIEFDSYSENLKYFEVKYCTNVSSLTINEIWFQLYRWNGPFKIKLSDGCKNEGNYNGIMRLKGTNTN